MSPIDLYHAQAACITCEKTFFDEDLQNICGDCFACKKCGHADTCRHFKKKRKKKAVKK